LAQGALKVVTMNQREKDTAGAGIQEAPKSKGHTGSNLKKFQLPKFRKGVLNEIPDVHRQP